VQPAGATATPGVDYTALPLTTVTFGPGETSKDVTVDVVGDTTHEKNETFGLKLSGATGATLADTAATAVIVDDDQTNAAPKPYVWIEDATVVEGNGGVTSLPMQVHLSWPAAGTTSVKVSTANKTASAGTDYTAVSATTVTFAPGQTVKTVPISILGDTSHEKNETFTVKLTNPVGLTAGDPTVTVTIIDDEGPLSVSALDTWVTEGTGSSVTMTFTIVLSAPPGAGETVSVKVQTAGGNAIAGTDYTALPLTTVTFGPNETAKTVSVTVAGDSVKEKSETIGLKLSGTVGVTIADATATGTIVDND
jgi:chitinase